LTENSQAQRRRRLLTRALPVVAICVVSFVAGVAVGASSPGREAAQRFADAWAEQDYAAMYAELSDDAAAAHSQGDFERAYLDADITATVDTITVGDAQEAESGSGGDVVKVPVTVSTHAYGNVEGETALPVDGESIAWEPSLVFPGLEPGETLDRREEVPERAAILARALPPREARRWVSRRSTSPGRSDRPRRWRRAS
jgi:hypothetical protein